MPNTFPTPNEAKTASYTSLGYKHPGRVTKGPAHNKPRIHLVSSKGKVPAAVYAAAIALKQKNQAANAAKMPKGTPTPQHADPHVRSEQLKNPPGVAKRPNPPHQNNPALAGRFTATAKAYANQRKAPVAPVDNPTDDAATEALERKRGIKT